MSDNESKSTSSSFTIDAEMTYLEFSIINFLGTDYKKTNNENLAQALKKLYNLLGTEDSKDGRMLIYAICEALTDEDSFWKLNLTHRGKKGEAIPTIEQTKQITKDVLALKLFEEQLADGIKRESIYAELAELLGLTVSGVRAALKRARERNL